MEMSAIEHMLYLERAKLFRKMHRQGLNAHEVDRLNELRARHPPSGTSEQGPSSSPRLGPEMNRPGAQFDVNTSARAPTPVAASANAHVTQAPEIRYPVFESSPLAPHINSRPAAPLALLSASDDLPAHDFWQALLDYNL